MKHRNYSVFERAGYRCEFVGEVRCAERTGLQIDHIAPYARGGSNDESNLRCLCGAHNRHVAKQAYGTQFMESKIRTARE